MRPDSHIQPGEFARVIAHTAVPRRPNSDPEPWQSRRERFPDGVIGLGLERPDGSKVDLYGTLPEVYSYRSSRKEWSSDEVELAPAAAAELDEIHGCMSAACAGSCTGSRKCCAHARVAYWGSVLKRKDEESPSVDDY